MHLKVSFAWLLLVVFTNIGKAAEPTLRWRTDYAAARKESLETGLPLLMQIGSDDCLYCRKMEATTLRDAAVQNAMTAQYIPLKIDGNREQTLVKALKIQVYPTTVLAGPDGTIHSIINGYVAAESFRDQLKLTTSFVIADRKIEKDLEEATANSKSGQFAKAFATATQIALVAKGKPNEQLAKAILDDIERNAAERLAKANQQVRAGFPNEAKTTFAEVAQNFAGTGAAAKAETQLIAMGAGIVDRSILTSKASSLLAMAKELTRAGAYADALEICDLLSHTVEASEAAKLADSIRADATKLAVAGRQANEQAAAIQRTLANSWASNGNREEAAKCLELAMKLEPTGPKSEATQTQLTSLRNGALIAIPAVRQR